MDYKEKYEMALEGIQEILGSGEDSIKMSRLQLRLQGIFPELKESDDERTWLINYLSNRILNSSIIAENENLKKAIAWLEKQGEQKPTTIQPKFEQGDWVINTITKKVEQVV